jgi:phage terminase large subunit
MAAWLKDRGQIPNRLDLDADLTAATYKFDHRNRLFLESKEDMKKRGMTSPDLADALALTFAQPIAPKDIINSGYRQTHAEDYDPLNRGNRPQMAEQWSAF